MKSTMCGHLSDGRIYSTNFQRSATASGIATRTVASGFGILVLMGMATIGPYRTADAQELRGYWQLNEPHLRRPARDSSGNGFFARFNGEVEPGVPGAPGFGSGMRFDGETAHLQVGQFLHGYGALVNDFTVMAWIKPEDLTRKHRVFGSAPVDGGWGWGIAGDNLELTTYGVKDYDQPVALEIDEWVHTAIVLDANNDASFFVNGEFVGTQTHATPGHPTTNAFYIGWSCCDDPQEHFQGSLDEVALFTGTLTADQIGNAMNFGAINFEGVPEVPGDYNNNGERDVNDIDLLQAAARLGDARTKFDLDGNRIADFQDVAYWVETLSNTYFGDFNFDGEFNSSDFVTAFKAAKFETGQAATWVDGDQNGDGLFNSNDFVTAFASSPYEQGPRPGGLMVVPEPSTTGFLLSGIASLALCRRQ